jgi:hypothetical protein
MHQRTRSRPPCYFLSGDRTYRHSFTRCGLGEIQAYDSSKQLPRQRGLRSIFPASNRTSLDSGQAGCASVGSCWNARAPAHRSTSSVLTWVMGRRSACAAWSEIPAVVTSASNPAERDPAHDIDARGEFGALQVFHQRRFRTADFLRRAVLGVGTLRRRTLAKSWFSKSAIRRDCASIVARSLRINTVSS